MAWSSWKQLQEWRVSDWGNHTINYYTPVIKEDHKHDDDDDHDSEDGLEFSIDQIVPIVDSILEQDDKVTDSCLISISLTIMLAVTVNHINHAML